MRAHHVTCTGHCRHSRTISQYTPKAELHSPLSRQVRQRDRTFQRKWKMKDMSATVRGSLSTQRRETFQTPQRYASVSRLYQPLRVGHGGSVRAALEPLRSPRAERGGRRACPVSVSVCGAGAAAAAAAGAAPVPQRECGRCGGRAPPPSRAPSPRALPARPSRSPAPVAASAARCPRPLAPPG